MVTATFAEGEHAKENRFATYFIPSELSIVESAANSYGMTVRKFIKMAAMRMAKIENK